MARVSFARQEGSDRIALICRLTRQLFEGLEGESRILIVVEDDNQALALDRQLWTFDKGAFLPHAIDNGAVDCRREPIVITTGEKNCNGADHLILGRPCSLDFIKPFDQAIDFAEVYDPALVQRSRQRFRVYRDHGLNPAMID